MVVLHPKDNSYLLEHEKAAEFLLNCWKEGKLHNSWIFSGEEGIGKATLAYKFARFLLWADENNKEKYTNLDIAENSLVFRQVASCSHPDMKVVERDFIKKDKDKIVKAINSGKPLENEDIRLMKKSAVISVDDVRSINQFLSKRSSAGWRVVIVDSVDELNTAGANAILKILEEPPAKTIMILISHNQNSLLPTIKSRCAKLMLQPLKKETVSSLLRRYCPQLAENQIEQITLLAKGSIGKAIVFADMDAATKYNQLCSLVYAQHNIKMVDLNDFANEMAKTADAFELVKELIFEFISNNIQTSDNGLDLADYYIECVKIFRDAENLNFDKKQTLIRIITNLARKI